LPSISKRIVSARFLKDGSKVEFTQSKYGFLFTIPKNERDDYDTVVELELAGG